MEGAESGEKGPPIFSGPGEKNERESPPLQIDPKWYV